MKFNEEQLPINTEFKVYLPEVLIKISDPTVKIKTTDITNDMIIINISNLTDKNSKTKGKKPHMRKKFEITLRTY